MIYIGEKTNPNSYRAKINFQNKCLFCKQTFASSKLQEICGYCERERELR